MDRRHRLPSLLLSLIIMLGMNACSMHLPGTEEQTGQGGKSATCDKQTPQGLCLIELAVSLPSPIRFEAQPANVQRLPDDSLKISRELVLVLPESRWTLTQANVVFKPAANGKGFDRIDGEARIPFDHMPILNKAKTGGGVLATLGYDLGKNLDKLGAPINPQTHYLFFAFEESFKVNFGFDDLGIPVRGGEGASKPFKFTPVPEAKLVMVLDVSDPFFYVSAKGLSPKKKKDDKKQDKKKKPSLNIGGFGYSYHNRIPETVTTDDFQKSMQGTLVLEGSVPFPPAPVISYTGFYLVDGAGKLQAISGDVGVGFPLKWLISFNISMGDAHAIADEKADGSEILMSGHFQPDTSWVPAVIPLFPEEDVVIALRLDTTMPARDFAHGKGSYALAGSAFAPEGLRFGKVFSKQGEFRITHEQITMSGGVDSDLSPFRFGAGTHFTAEFSGREQDNRLTIDGNILIGAFDSRGRLTLTPSAVMLTGSLAQTGDLKMDFQGQLQQKSDQGQVLTGSFTVPPSLNNRAAQAIRHTAEETTQSLQSQIATLTTQLSNLTADLPSVRRAAQTAASSALNEMDTGNKSSMVNQVIGKECKGKTFICTEKAKGSFNDDKQVQQTKSNLSNLIAVLKKKDDPGSRAALKSALQNIIQGNPVRVSILGRKMSFAYLDGNRKRQLQLAIDHIDKLKESGGKKIDLQQELDRFQQSLLSRVSQRIAEGADPVSVNRLGFEMPVAQRGPIQLEAGISIEGEPKIQALSVSFDPAHPESLPGEIAKGLVSR